ncbi:Chaperone protein EcpD precursor [compost metagenome]
MLVSNPTPYYVSIASVNVSSAQGAPTPVELDMLPPFAKDVALQSKQNLWNVSKVEYSYIDDLGATRKSSVDLK